MWEGFVFVFLASDLASTLHILSQLCIVNVQTCCLLLSRHRQIIVCIQILQEYWRILWRSQQREFWAWKAFHLLNLWSFTTEGLLGLSLPLTALTAHCSFALLFFFFFPSCLGISIEEQLCHILSSALVSAAFGCKLSFVISSLKLNQTLWGSLDKAVTRLQTLTFLSKVLHLLLTETIHSYIIPNSHWSSVWSNNATGSTRRAWHDCANKGVPICLLHSLKGRLLAAAMRSETVNNGVETPHFLWCRWRPCVSFIPSCVKSQWQEINCPCVFFFVVFFFFNFNNPKLNVAQGVSSSVFEALS